MSLFWMSGAKLNGCIGTIQGSHSQRGHWTVEMSPGGRYGISSESLRPVIAGCLELVDVPGKGKGFRAKKHITAGHIVLFEPSFCFAPVGPENAEKMAAICHSKLRKALSPQAEDDLMALSVGHPMSRIGKPKLVAIMENNSFQCSRDPDFAALYLKTSLFKHSCCPNAVADTSRDQVVVRALQDIDVGDEVCIPYLPLTMPLTERRQTLAGKGFQCACPRCVREEAEGDPQFDVPCRCGGSVLNLLGGMQLPGMPMTGGSQACAACGRSVDSEASLATLVDTVEAANDFMQTLEAMQAHPARLVELLERAWNDATSRHPAPPRHQQVLQLMNNLANAHYFLSKVPGAQQGASMKRFIELKREVLSQQAKIYGAGVQYRDMNYMTSLHRLLMGSFSDPGERRTWQKEMEECLLHFGQRQLPTNLTSLVQR